MGLKWGQNPNNYLAAVCEKNRSNCERKYIMTLPKKIGPYLEMLWQVIDFFRPKFYNRLTWVVVITGLLLMGSPWWSDLAIALASRYLGVALQNAEPHFGWGMTLVFTGLAYHAFVHYVGELINERRDMRYFSAQFEHDQQVFATFSEIMSEEELGRFLRTLLDEHAFSSQDAGMLERVCSHLLAPATQFMDSNLVQVGTTFGVSLQNLANWISLNFWVFGNAGNHTQRFCLFPEGNEDRASGAPTADQVKRYAELTAILDAKVKDASETYNEFRAVIKRGLAV